jgi:hypothetical protein
LPEFPEFPGLPAEPELPDVPELPVAPLPVMFTFVTPTGAVKVPDVLNVCVPPGTIDLPPNKVTFGVPAGI